MISEKTLLLFSALVFAGSINAISVSVGSSCGSDEPVVSLNKTTGGHIAEPGFYPNQVCLEKIKYTQIRDNCNSEEQLLFTMESKNNSHLSIYDNEYSYELCAPRLTTQVRDSCLGNETKLLSVASDNNSHAAAPGYTDTAFDRSLCIAKKVPENVTVSLSGLSSPVYADGSEISSGSSITPPINYPYIVDNQPKGMIGYGQVLRISRTSSDTVSITQGRDSGGFLLPLTDGGRAEIEDEEEQIVNREFLNSISASFSFARAVEPTVKVFYTAPHSVNGFDSPLGTGTNNLRLKNLGLQGQNLTVGIEPQ